MADIKITSTALQGNLSAKISPDQLNIQQALVKGTPPSLSNASRAVILRGEVQATNNDGTTQIKTPRGTVTVRLETALPQGQKVDIQLSSGTPPREAIIQTATPRAQPSQTQNTPHDTPQKQTSQTHNAPAQSTPTQTAKPPPSENIEGVKNLQTTAKQAAETIANTVRQSVNPEAIIRQPSGDIPQAARTLIAGQAVRLTTLPPNLQNPTALAQLPMSPSPLQIIKQQLPTMLNAAALLNGTSILGQTPTAPLPQNLFQAPITLNSPLLKSITLQQPNLSPNLSANIIPSQTMPVKMMGMAQTTIGDARVLSIQTPNSMTQMTIASITPMQSTTTPVMAGQILAQATGITTPSGNPIIQIQMPAQTNLTVATPITQGALATPQFFALNYPATNLPKGTQIVLQPTTTPSPSPQASQASWPVLEDAFELLLGQLTQTQGQSLLNTIPRPASAGFQFTAAAMIFIAATRGGDIAGWMGNRADMMLRNIGDKDNNIASRLLRDIGTNTGRAAGADAPPSIQNAPEWRGHTLPLLFGMEITKMNLWTKPFGDDEANDNPETKKGMRFIVDLDLSRMGNVQLDGLIQPYAKRLDLALKTEQEFGTDTRTYIRGLWHRALNQIDMSGGLDFQTT